MLMTYYINKYGVWRETTSIITPYIIVNDNADLHTVNTGALFVAAAHQPLIIGSYETYIRNTYILDEVHTLVVSVHLWRCEVKQMTFWVVLSIHKAKKFNCLLSKTYVMPSSVKIV